MALKKTLAILRSQAFFACLEAGQYLFNKSQKMLSVMAFVLLFTFNMKNNRTKRNQFGKLLNTLVVVGPGYRCMAFRDRAGQLRNFWNGQILPLPAHILDPENEFPINREDLG